MKSQLFAGPKLSVNSFRMKELRYITDEYSSKYLLISAPVGYGKTHLLHEVEKIFRMQGWLSVYLDLSRGKDYSIQDLSLNILQKLNDEPIESLKLKSSIEYGYRIGKYILEALRGLLIIIDNAEALSTGTAEQFFDQFIPIIHETLLMSTSATTRFRLICAGSHISQWKRLSFKLPLEKLVLTPFGFTEVERIVDSFENENRIRMDSEYKKEFAAWLMDFTDGHPGCVTETLHAIGYPIPLVMIVSNETKAYEMIIKPVIEQIREDLPPNLRKVFETLSVVRRFSSRFLRWCIDKSLIQWTESEGDLENELVKTYFVEKRNGFMDAGTIRGLLAHHLRKTDLSLFIKICEESISFYTLCLRDEKSGYRPDIIFIELLYQQLQYLVYQHNGSKEQFFEILDQSLILLVSKRDHRAVINSVIELLNTDWEFRFIFNYLFREKAYKDHLFDELIEKIRNRAEVLENIEKIHEPDHWDDMVFLGRVYLEEQQFEKAIEILKQASQYNVTKIQPFLLQAIKAKADKSNDIEQQNKGHANLEIKLANRQEDLCWQDELVLKFEITNKGNIPANGVSVQLSQHSAYKIIDDSLFQSDFITPVHPMELRFKIRPIQKDFTLTLNIAYTDTRNETTKEQKYEYPIQLYREPQTQSQFERIDNPYRSGNLTQDIQSGDTRMFYGRRDTIQELKNILIENNEGLVILYGQRRTGKSCLLKYIERSRCFAPDVFIIFTNIQGLASEQDFYGDILKLAALAHTASNIKTQAHSFDEFTNVLFTLQEAVKTPFLIMLDEFEYVTDEHFKYTSLQDATDFIRRFRNFIQYSARIKFVLAGADGLRAMINDYHNPLFKIGRTFHIAFLTDQDARSLITEPLQDNVIYTDQAITSIHQATANHPYYIQLLCQTIVMQLNQKKTNTVTITEVNQSIEYLEKTGDGHFDYVWDITSKEAHLLLAIVAKEMQATPWVARERIDEIIIEHKLSLPEDSVDAALKELLEKNLIAESHTKLEYTIPMGLLHTWIIHYKPLKKVRREVNA